MTDTTRELIQRMADALTNAIRVIHNEDGTQHISTAAPVLDEARAYLAQPKPEWPTVMAIIELADEIEAEGLGQVDLVRRALSRWGRPTTTTANQGG
jgi:hypothetical protein